MIGETAKGDPLVICPLLRARPLQRVPDAVVQSAVARAPALDGEDGDAQGGRAALGVRLGAGAVDEGDETCGRYGPSGCGRAGDRDRVGRSDVGRRAGASDTAHARRPEQLHDPEGETPQSHERSEQERHFLSRKPTHHDAIKEASGVRAKKIRSGGGQDDPEHGAALAPVRRGDAAAEALDDARRDREAEPGGRLLGREERFEDARQDRAGDPGSTVAHLEDAAERIGRGGHGDLAAAVPVAQLVILVFLARAMLKTR